MTFNAIDTSAEAARIAAQGLQVLADTIIGFAGTGYSTTVAQNGDTLVVFYRPLPELPALCGQSRSLCDYCGRDIEFGKVWHQECIYDMRFEREYGRKS